jgi:uncharacterized membrane protein/NAD-dependent dihydropyrimidine dehydrogenase PreA subunit
MDNQDQAPEPRQTDRWLEPGKTNLQVIYILYLASFVIGISGIVGIVLAYLNRGKSEAWLESHYTWAIRTFWIGLLGSFISFILFVVVIGMFTIILVAIWVIVRTVIGLQKLGRNEPIADPESWLMQTNFTAEQLADPHVAHSEKILRTCVHCGFCTATCPTYAILGDELDSPRGRIYLIKDMLENDRAADEKTVKHIDRCLSCLSCMTTCPSGVHYMHLVDHARAHIENTYKRPWHDRLIRETRWPSCCPIPTASACRFAALFAKPFAPIMSRMGGPFAVLARCCPCTRPKCPPAAQNRARFVARGCASRPGRALDRLRPARAQSRRSTRPRLIF